MSQRNEASMSQDLKSWGVALIIMGALHFVVPLLAPFWGMVIIPLGILVLIVHHRVMFIVIGACLALVGLLNIFGTLNANVVGFWTFMGFFQIFLGIREMFKFAKFGKTGHAQPVLLEETSHE